MVPGWPKDTPEPKLYPRLVFSDYLDPSGRVGALKTTIRIIDFKFTFINKIIYRDAAVPRVSTKFLKCRI